MSYNLKVLDALGSLERFRKINPDSAEYYDLDSLEEELDYQAREIPKMGFKKRDEQELFRIVKDCAKNIEKCKDYMKHSSRKGREDKPGGIELLKKLLLLVPLGAAGVLSLKEIFGPSPSYEELVEKGGMHETIDYVKNEISEYVKSLGYENGL